MNIEEIMKPYYEKMEVISNRPGNYEFKQNATISQYEEQNNAYRAENDSYELEIKTLQTRLKNLRDNKNIQIEEYVQNAVAARPAFYAGYGAMIRKDLEQDYLNREKALELEIIALSNKMNENYLKISNNNKLIETENSSKISEVSIHRVDLRELVDVKHDLRKKIIAARKELEIKIKETQLKQDAIMYKMSTFNHKYDEDHNVLNGADYRKLFDESHLLIELQQNYEKQLVRVDECLKITELTEEEAKTIMMAMTPVEKAEYDRRKAINFESEQKEESVAVVSDAEESTVEEPKKEEEYKLEPSYLNFIKGIAKDVMDSVNKLRTIKIEKGKYITTKQPGYDAEQHELEDTTGEKIEYANGLYLYEKDISKALNNYGRLNKGRTFTVNGIEFEVNRQTIKKVKKALKKCTSIKLLNEKKISFFDIKRVFGKEKAEEYTNQTELENLETTMPSGNYILRSDVYKAFKDLFEEKTQTWFERLSSRFKLDEEEEKAEIQDAEYKTVSDEMSWTAEEPEYEVIKARKH